MTVGEKIKVERLKKKWNQEQLAKLLNVSRSTVSSWEVGRNSPDLETIVLISDLFGISLDNLLREEKDMLKTREELSFKLEKVADTFQMTKDSTKIIYQMQTASALPTQRKYDIKDSQQKLIGTIKRKRYSLRMYDLPRLFLNLDHFNDISIIKDMEQFRSIYKIKGEDLKIEGTFLGDTFSIMKKEVKISDVIVEKKNDTFSFTFSILDEKFEELIACFLFLIALVYEEEKNVIRLA